MNAQLLSALSGPSLAGEDDAPHLQDGRAETERVTAEQLHAALRRRVHHRLGLLHVQGHRLLGDGVFARVRNEHDVRAVEVVGCRDPDSLDIRVGAERLGAVVDAGVGETRLERFADAGVGVRRGHQFYLVQALHAGHDLRRADAHADDAHLQGSRCRHKSPPKETPVPMPSLLAATARSLSSVASAA